MSFMLQFFVLSLKTAKSGSELHNKISPTSNISSFVCATLLWEFQLVSKYKLFSLVDLLTCYVYIINGFIIKPINKISPIHCNRIDIFCFY